MNAEQRTKNIEGGYLRIQHLMFIIQMLHRTDWVRLCKALHKRLRG